LITGGSVSDGDGGGVVEIVATGVENWSVLGVVFLCSVDVVYLVSFFPIEGKMIGSWGIIVDA